ncbi:MAG TPA: hypothetical protein VMT10_11895 [Solirubrobacteraceae bacterium]|nr:hypothetical protein [Solirubrobacteraceae bacterium]
MNRTALLAVLVALLVPVPAQAALQDVPLPAGASGFQVVAAAAPVGDHAVIVLASPIEVSGGAAHILTTSPDGSVAAARTVAMPAGDAFSVAAVAATGESRGR